MKSLALAKAVAVTVTLCVSCGIVFAQAQKTPTTKKSLAAKIRELEQRKEQTQTERPGGTASEVPSPAPVGRTPAPTPPPVAQPTPSALHIVAATPPQQLNYYTGDGGKGIRIAVLEPTGKGLSADELWMLSLAQGSITGDFNKYSAMTVIDRQNLEKIFAEWKESMSGNYSDADQIKIGNLTNASHILTGSVSKTDKKATVFMLAFAVTDVASGERKASYSPAPVSLLAIKDLSAIKTATADLLRQLGVAPTDAARAEFTQAVDMARIQAETMLALGIVAQRQGTEVTALSYFYQAEAFDPSLLEAAKRSSVMAANISSGNIGADVRNDILWRKNWVARLTETEETFDKIINAADPPYTLYYSTYIHTGSVNYQKETAELSISTVVSANGKWFSAMAKSLQAAQAVVDGLKSTNREDDWGFKRWPREGVSGANPFATEKRYDITVVFELVNQRNKVIGSQTVRLNPSFKLLGHDFVSYNKQIEIEFTEFTHNTIKFNEVKANDISDNLTIRVASVNGASPQNARFAINAVLIEKSQPFVDARNGRTYKTVKFGPNIWMAENLNYRPQAGNARCYGENYYEDDEDTTNCTIYGRLYDWNTAMKACPIGWHLPTRREWDFMVGMAGGNGKVAVKRLRSTSGWEEAGYGNGTDDYGFSALPGGCRGGYNSAGREGYWWTATESGFDSDQASYRKMSSNNEGLDSYGYGKSYGLSVRCVRD